MKTSTRNFILGLCGGCVLTVAAGGLLVFGLGAWTILQMRNLDSELSPAELPPPPVPTLVDPLDFDWHLHSLDGERFELEQYRGQPMVINFWATWCMPCVKEMPALEKLAESFARDEVAIVLLSEESLDTLNEFVEERDLALPVLRVAGAPEGVSFPSPIPTTWIVDGAGNIVFRHTGAADWANEAVIRYLESLADSEPATGVRTPEPAA